MFEIKWGKRVLLTIIWNHRKWHAHLNPVKKRKALAGVAGVFGTAFGGSYPKKGE